MNLALVRRQERRQVIGVGACLPVRPAQGPELAGNSADSRRPAGLRLSPAADGGDTTWRRTGCRAGANGPGQRPAL